jgi:hypothetical protein
MLVEPLISLWHIFNPNHAANNPAQVYSPTLDQFDQLRSQGLGINDTSLEKQTLGPECRLGKFQRWRYLGRLRTTRRGALCEICADLAYATTRDGNVDHMVNYGILLRFQLRVQTLITHTVTTAIYTQLLKLEDLFYSIAFGEIDRNSANLLALCQSRLDVVNDVDFRCAAEERRVSAQQADGPGTENSDGLSSSETREVETSPGCGPDIGDEQVGELVGGVVWDGDECCVSLRDANILR